MTIREMSEMLATLSTAPIRENVKIQISGATEQSLVAFGGEPGAFIHRRFDSDRIVRESVLVTISEIPWYLTRTRPATKEEILAEAERLRHLSEGTNE